MTPELTAPIDDTHVMSVEAIADIRRKVMLARARIASWEPRPCPSHKRRR